MISVIVPIYKVEDYLPACIDSILASTYQDFELILVDDGSPDGCGAICDSYAARDNRIKVIHQENQWVSTARNAGLKVAVGEFISFVDSDDVIHPRMLEVLHDAIASGDYDYSMVNWRYNQGQTQAEQEKDILLEEVSTKLIGESEFMMGLSNLGITTREYNVVWNKLFKHELIEGLWFKDLIAQDMEWLTRFCLIAKKGIYVDAPLYDYTVRDNSLMRTDWKARKLAEVHSFYECLQDIPEDKPQYRALWLKSVYSVLFNCRNVNKHEERMKEVSALSRKIYNETKFELFHSELSLSRKCRIFLLYHFPGVYQLLFRLRYGLMKG